MTAHFRCIISKIKERGFLFDEILLLKARRGAEKNLHLCRVGAFENPQ
jgi:hypothetical protein